MTQQPKKQPKIDLKVGPNLDDKALEQLADITPADINASAALWDSKTKLPGLLEARVQERSKQSE